MGIRKKHNISDADWSLFKHKYMYHMLDIVDAKNIVPYPVVIPSYNRPECKFLSVLKKKGQIEDFDIHLMVRYDQVKSYKKLWNKYKNITIHALPEYVSNINETRNAIVKMMRKLKLYRFFLIDDDIQSMSIRLLTKKDNGNYQYYQRIMPFIKILSIWSYLIDKYEKSSGDILGLSHIPQRSLYWAAKEDSNHFINKSYINNYACIYLNARQLKEHKVNYKKSIDYCPEDYCLTLDVIMKDANYITFPCMCFGCEDNAAGDGGNDYSEMEKQRLIGFELMNKKYPGFVKQYKQRTLGNLEWRIIAKMVNEFYYSKKQDQIKRFEKHMKKVIKKWRNR